MLHQDIQNWFKNSSLAYVKRAIEIAANGKHSIVLSGMPSNGKSAMLHVLAELQGTFLQSDDVQWFNHDMVISRQTALRWSSYDGQILMETHNCRCGYYGSPYHACECSVLQISAFQRRFHPSFMNSIPMHIRMDTRDMQDRGQYGETVEQVQARMVTEWVELSFTNEAKNLFEVSNRRLNLSPRSVILTTKVANTIALMDNASKIAVHHAAEALQYVPVRW